MSEEMWHVQIEPGDVKTVTLEQMDDMYRLELIQASTLVWQPGMAKALPLSVVAGIDDEESDVMEIEPELIPEPVRPPTSYQPPPSVRQPTIAPPAISRVAPVASAPVPPAPSLPTPDFYSPASLRPITMSDTPSFRPQRKGVFGRVLMGVAIAAGILITLYRNDLLRPVAASAGSEAAYNKIEAALGSPGFGTTRSVASFSATLNPDMDPTLQAATGGTSQTTATGTSEGAATDADSTATQGDSSDSDSDAKPAAAKQDNADRSSPPARKSPVRRKSAAPGKKLKSFKSSEYDPMNAKL